MSFEVRHRPIHAASERGALFCGVVLAFCASACADSEDAPNAATPDAEHLYALQTLVYQTDDTTRSYVALTDSLDVEGEISLDDAREFPGYSFISGIANKLLVSSGETPEIVQYSIGANR